jgi:hypothetical protein
VLAWVGEDRTEEAVGSSSPRRWAGGAAMRSGWCAWMWVPYGKLVKDHAPQAQLLFDRLPIVSASI